MALSAIISWVRKGAKRPEEGWGICGDNGCTEHGCPTPGVFGMMLMSYFTSIVSEYQGLFYEKAVA
jgi:hypothetical protein